MEHYGIERFYTRAGKPVPSEHGEVVKVIARERMNVHALRLKHWPNRKSTPEHRPRWTGGDLAEDARTADRYGAYGFAEFYAKRFAPICWNTHGSGLAGIRTVSEDHFPGVSALGFGESVQFALVGAELVLKPFGKHDPITEARFRALEMQRREVRARVLVTYPSFLAEAGLQLE